MFLLLFIVWNALCADGAKMQTTDAWLEQCEIVMKEANVFGNFSREVAHGIHAMSLQDIRAFFDKEATPENGVPTANRNLNSKEENIVLPNAPDIKGEFQSIAMHTFDVGLRNMNRRNYFQKSGILERLAHHFHMIEVWTKSQTFYQDYVDSGVSNVICGCALDTAENGIDYELESIFYYFKHCFGRSSYFLDYFVHYGAADGSKCPVRANVKVQKLPKLKNSRTWKKWKKMIQRSMSSDEDLRKFSLFMYCALNG